MAKTPIGDILPYLGVPKYAVANSGVQLYAFKNGVSGLQPLKKIEPNNLIGYMDGWFAIGNNIYFLFYPTINDYNNQTNPYYFKYVDYKKISFPNVATWQNKGVDFGAISTNIQQIIDRYNKEAETFASIFSNTANKLLLITAVYFGFKILTNGNK